MCHQSLATFAWDTSRPTPDRERIRYKKLDRCDELVIAPESRVKPAAQVVDQAVGAVDESSQRNGRSFDVLEESLERLAVAFRYPARRVEIETRVLPALKKLHAFGGDRLAFEHHLEGSSLKSSSSGVKSRSSGAAWNVPSWSKTPREETLWVCACGLRRFPKDCGVTIMPGIAPSIAGN